MTSLLKLAVCLVVPLGGGFLSGWSAASSPREWYERLRKPGFNPPEWLFGPAWTVLYLLMGLAAFLVWQRGAGAAGVVPALILFAVQLVPNWLWTPLFFGRRRPGLALADISLLWLLIGATLLLFLRVSVLAGLLLVPYLAWVSFATLLNAAIVRLNRPD